jgi:hypothetical protein
MSCPAAVHNFARPPSMRPLPTLTILIGFLLNLRRPAAGKPANRDAEPPSISSARRASMGVARAGYGHGSSCQGVRLTARVDGPAQSKRATRRPMTSPTQAFQCCCRCDDMPLHGHAGDAAGKGGWGAAGFWVRHLSFQVS